MKRANFFLIVDLVDEKNIDIDDEERLDFVRMRALITNMYECFQIRFLEIIKGLI